MNSTIQVKTTTPPLLLTLALFCFALLSGAQAVSPPPDGGYARGNTAEGQNALFSLTSGSYNTAVGYLSLTSDTTASFNTAVGAGALLANTATENTATGAGALLSNSTGPFNTADGALALFSNKTGDSNTAVGAAALFSNTDGHDNTAVGQSALLGNTIGNANTANGSGALAANTTAGFNTANGYRALADCTGAGNTALGASAGSNLTTGNSNIDLRNDGVAGESATIRIGETNVQTATYIAGIAGQTVGMGGSTCYVDNDGKLGVFLSARRFKTDIADMATGSEAILALQPVTFHYKPELDKTRTPQFGLIAEEVAKINPDLVTHDANGDISTVRYEAVNVMLLNEFLKAHRRIEEQDKRIDQLTAQLKEQAVLIQQVNDKVALTNPAQQTALNNY